jgi:SAM-dependent methyltransferase
MEFLEIIKKLVGNDEIISAVISNKINKEKDYKKIDLKPFLKDGEIYYQIAYVYDKKTIHENIDKSSFIEKTSILFSDFKQMIVFSTNSDYQFLRNKKGIKVLKNKPSKKKYNLLHNRKKKYVIPEGKPCNFLEILGLMDKNGNVYKNKYDKFKQINKYLEFIRDVESELRVKKKVRIVDFGSGKAYLTFALYYYITEIMGLEAEITGIDLKEDVVKFCNQTSKELGYKNLKFLSGDIRTFNQFENIDMIVALHACDIATDMAIAQGIKWKSRIIMVVPCCQHELFNQIENKIMMPILKHGILKERFASIVTDAARGVLLESEGYLVQFAEFVNIENTPKNILIRAVYRDKENKEIYEEYFKFKKALNINPYLERNI